MSIPGLPKGVRSTVFERLVNQLKLDPVLSRIVKRWNVWDKPFATAASAGTEVEIQLTPRPGPSDWFTPGEQAGDLVIQVDLWAPGDKKGQYHAADALDLWEAIERALYPADKAKRQAFKRDLQCLGATTGEIQIAQPAAVQPVGDNSFVQIGLLRLAVKRSLNN